MAKSALLIQFLAFSVIATVFAGKSKAEVIFSDNFDAEPVVSFVNAYTGFASWNVTKGTVDILRYDQNWHAAISGGWSVSDGLIVDMGGFENGAIETKEAFLLSPGTYELSFLASGNLRVGDDLLTVSIGSFFSKSYFFPMNEPKRLITDIFTVSAAGLAKISFDNVNSYPFGHPEPVGTQIDGILLRSRPVPEPTAIALFGFGTLIGGCVRFRKPIP